MSGRVTIAAFAGENDLLQAVAAVRERHWPIIEAYTPFPVHGLDRAMGLRPSRLSVVAFICGLLGVALALGGQFWTTGWDWPLNVGGQPWNSLPAFVPVTFEAMVLCAGLGLFLAWLLRCGLYPGKSPQAPSLGETDNRFVLVLGETGPDADGAAVENLLRELRAVTLEQREA
jgi:Protein of unknown function (DUF3341)